MSAVQPLSLPDVQKSARRAGKPLFRRKSLGFTVIELIVVIFIMAMMAALIAVNFNGQRADRNLNIAQNELVTNLRKAQSYTLSSRVVTAGQSGQVFILKFDGSAAGHSGYVLQAVYNINTTPPAFASSVETYQLPPGVYFSSTPVTIYRDSAKYSTPTQVGSCALLAFKTPFAKIFFNGASNAAASAGSVGSGCYLTPGGIDPADDYGHILNYVTNVDGYTTSTDSYAVINLTDSTGQLTRKVMVRGVTGVICPTKDGVNCSN